MKNSRCPYCGPNTYRPLPDYFGKLSPLDDYGIFVIPGRKEGNLMAVNSDRDGLQMSAVIKYCPMCGQKLEQ